jgi:hypothetical protein
MKPGQPRDCKACPSELFARQSHFVAKKNRQGGGAIDQSRRTFDSPLVTAIRLIAEPIESVYREALTSVIEPKTNSERLFSARGA